MWYNKRMEKIGVFGGSFNPVHNEHIKIALNAVSELGLSKLIIMPANIPPHKKGARLASPFDRLNMLKLAFKDKKNIEVSDFEILNNDVSFTYKTLEHIKSIYKDSQIFFLVGTDMLEDFATWKNTDRILEIAKLFVTKRDGEDFEKALSVFEKNFSKSSILVAKINGEKVSSTAIRDRISLKLFEDLEMPTSVKNYILEKGLYKGDKFFEFVAKNLPISRLKHTFNVMELAKTYAKKLGEDVEKAKLSALLHDCCKYKTEQDFGFQAFENVPKQVVHQFLGAKVCREVLEVEDLEIINAIKYHTTGRANMTRLEKIVFLADLLEKDRLYEGVDVLRKAVLEDFEKGFRLAVSELYRHLLKNNGEIYYLTKECFDFYCKD